MTRSRSFVRDDGETELVVDYTVSGGSEASGLSGPPEDYDPGSAFEVEDVVAFDANGATVELTDAERDRLETEVNEDPETWAYDDYYDDRE